MEVDAVRTRRQPGELDLDQRAAARGHDLDLAEALAAGILDFRDRLFAGRENLCRWRGDKGRAQSQRPHLTHTLSPCPAGCPCSFRRGS